MDVFEIEVEGKTYEVSYDGDGYSATLAGQFIGWLNPDLTDAGLTWSSREIRPVLAQQLGERIEAYLL